MSERTKLSSVVEVTSPDPTTEPGTGTRSAGAESELLSGVRRVPSDGRGAYPRHRGTAPRVAGFTIRPWNRPADTDCSAKGSESADRVKAQRLGDGDLPAPRRSQLQPASMARQQIVVRLSTPPRG